MHTIESFLAITADWHTYCCLCLDLLVLFNTFFSFFSYLLGRSKENLEKWRRSQKWVVWVSLSSLFILLIKKKGFSVILSKGENRKGDMNRGYAYCRIKNRCSFHVRYIKRERNDMSFVLKWIGGKMSKISFWPGFVC